MLQRTLADDRLLARVVARDQVALVVLLRRHDGTLRRALRRHGLAPDLHDDALAAVALNLWQAAADLEAAGLAGWLYVTARRRAIDLLRREGRHLTAEFEADELVQLPDPAADPADVVVARDTVAQMQRRIVRLPPVYRETLLLRVQEGLGNRQIAAALGVTEATVRSRISTAMARIRQPT